MTGEEVLAFLSRKKRADLRAVLYHGEERKNCVFNGEVGRAWVPAAQWSVQRFRSE